MRNPDARMVDFSELAGIIEENPKFLASDIDLIYERKGHFLVVEFKRGAEQLSRGQELMLKQLAKTPRFAVVKVDGYSENGKLIIGNIEYLSPDETFLYAGTGLERFKQIIRNWYKKVNND